MMTVLELVTLLKEHPPSMQVYTLVREGTILCEAEVTPVTHVGVCLVEDEYDDALKEVVRLS